MLLQLREPGQTPLPHEITSPAIGIDLGTTHSLVAISREGQPEIILNADNKALIPSIIGYQDQECLVGSAALLYQSKYPLKALSSFKRFMGQVQSDSLPYSFKIEGKDKSVSAIEASSEILKHLKKQAEDYLGSEVDRAVITVPAYFDEAARVATRQAAHLAGLKVLRLVNEPTAAALAYGLDQNVRGVYAIYDLGGGTFDLSLLKLEGEVFKVLATGGDVCLGGDDIDQKISSFLWPNILTPTKKTLSLGQARKIKEYLSTHEEWSGIFEINQPEEKVQLTREQLNALMAPLIQKTLTVCRQVLQDAHLHKKDIDGIVLVGGTTRIPFVQQAVEQFFGQSPLTNLNPDEIVALGAALQAEALTQGSDRLLLDVTPLSLGVETYGGLAEKIIHRNTPLPAIQYQDFTTFENGQTAISFHVVQGEREMAQDCRSLARFELKNIPPLGAGQVRVRVNFILDADGLLTVEAHEQQTGQRQILEIKPSSGLTKEELRAMIEASHLNAQHDIDQRLLHQTQVEAQRLLQIFKSALDNTIYILTSQEVQQMKKVCTDFEKVISKSDVNRAAILTNCKIIEEHLRLLAKKRIESQVP